MLVTDRWLRMSGTGHHLNRGLADLRHYDAEFCEAGDGPPLVLVPGLAGGTDLVQPLVQRLARHFRVVAYQTRGETDCFALRRRFSLDDLACDLDEFIRWQGLERPAVVGVSFGGLVAMGYAARFPGRIAGLGVQGVGVRYQSSLIQRIAGMVLSSYPLPGDCPFVNQFFNLLFGHRPTAEQFEHATRRCWQTDQSIMAYRLSLLRRFDLDALLPRISTPTVVVSGSRDMIVSDSNAAELQRRLPDACRTVIQRAGHLAPVSHAALTADILTRFLAPLVA
jgi:3-oxoadipate enol-lactonase